MTHQRARYLRRAIPRHRRCPKCRFGTLSTEKIEVSTYADLGRGQRAYLNGWTTCDRCDHRQTEPVS